MLKVNYLYNTYKYPIHIYSVHHSFFFFIHGEVFDTLLIQSQRLGKVSRIQQNCSTTTVKLILVLSTATQQAPQPLRKFQKMQLFYCNSQKNFTKKCFKSTFVVHFSAFQDFQNQILFQYSKLSYNIKVNFCELSDILRFIF